MTTYIIGSKSNPIYPKKKPDEIIYVNGSVFYLEKNFFKHANKNLVLSPHVCVQDFQELIEYKKNITIVFFKKIRKFLSKKFFSKIYIRPISDEINFKFDYSNLKYEELIIFENDQFNIFLKKQFNIENFTLRVLYFFQTFIYDPKNVIKYFLGITNIMKMPQFKISSGILALMIALDNKKFTPPYYVIGIGMDASGYNYDETTSGTTISSRKNHILADLSYLKQLKKQNKNSNNIIFTDIKLSKYFENI